MDKKTLLSSKILFFIAFLLTLLFALNGKYISTGYNIEVGQVSSVQLKANRDVENTVKYERQVEEIRTNTEPRYIIDTEISDKVYEIVEDFFIIVDEQRKLYKSYAQTKTTTSPPFDNGKMSTFLNNEEEIYTLLTATDEDYNTFKNGTINIFKSTLDAGVKESDLEKNLVYVTEQFSNLTTNESLNNVGVEIYETFFEANIIIDEDATNKAIEDKVNELEPEIYLKGQTIVNDGDIVTNEQYMMLKDLGYVDTSLSEKSVSIFGIFSLIVAIFYIAYNYIKKIYCVKKILSKNKIFMLFSVYVGTLIFVTVTNSLAIYFSPILLSILTVSVFLGAGFGTFYTIFIISVSSLIVGANVQYFTFMIISGVFVSMLSKEVFQRKNVFKITLIYSMFNVFIYFGITTLFKNTVTINIFIDLLAIGLNAIVTVLLCFGLIPVFEIAFSILTPNKLLELSNPENELLKRCTFEIPGTYHHSLVVANLAEVAAISIGANPSLVRVGAYYHDIGKLKNSIYFSENQDGENIHDTLNPLESFEHIVGHIEHGLTLAKKHRLPKEISDMIVEHHGTTLVKYFYIKAKNDNPDDDTITEDMFRYNGPKPQSKEAAILMFADTCEAAVRSIVNKVKKFDEVEDFISTLIKSKIDDGQMTECDITYGDVEKIKQAFSGVFKGMYHERIEYPKLNKANKEKDKENNDGEK